MDRSSDGRRYETTTHVSLFTAIDYFEHMNISEILEWQIVHCSMLTLLLRRGRNGVALSFRLTGPGREARENDFRRIRFNTMMT